MSSRYPWEGALRKFGAKRADLGTEVPRVRLGWEEII